MAKDFTAKKLTDVTDAAVKGGFSETQEARFAGGDLDASDTGVSHHRLHPNKRQAFGHRHEKAEEVYVVLSGSGRVKLEDEIVELEPLLAVRVAPQVTRQFEAGDEGLEWIAFGPHHDSDGEIVPGWWSD
jgi:mannose-6-phosphate isomerase-like protein (cupin superfamily)